MRRTPTQCPVCDLPLSISELRCRGCGTTLRGEFTLSRCSFCNLPPDQLKFLELFLRCRGNLRELERTLGLSYPTVRARLDSLHLDSQHVVQRAIGGRVVARGQHCAGYLVEIPGPHQRIGAESVG